jgi:gamma-glutamyl-gamma-aminobutyrate hydrolase PuuD
MVNSVHHQGIRNLAPGFVVEAVADDGIIRRSLDRTNAWSVFSGIRSSTT